MTLTAAQQEQWNDAHDGEPTVVVLWDKRQTARQSHECNCCGEEIAQGTVYQSAGYIVDGERSYEKLHLYAYHCPSGCPSRRAKDIAEMEVAP